MAVAGAIPLAPALGQGFKDQSRILPEAGGDEVDLPAPVEITTLPPPPDSPGAKSDRLMPGDDTMPADSIPLDEMPALEAVDLTLDVARRALDAYAGVRDKYTGEGLDRYETLEEFVAATAAGKRLEADIRAFGFSGVGDWNRAIMAVGFAYNAIADNSETTVREQIDQIRQDATMAETEKTRLIASLQTLLPSDNNKVIVRQLMLDPQYRDKLALLAVYE
jgi:hypothetical protein